MQRFLNPMRIPCSVIFSMLMGCVCLAQPQQPDILQPSIEDSLRHFLQKFDNDKATRYVIALRDLDGDGNPEAIVYLNGGNWCGSGGCNTLILTRSGLSWRVVTSIAITRLPIRVLKQVSIGWHSLGVYVQGGGILLGYEAELDFNGTTYPQNPSVPPARRLKQAPAGIVVIPEGEKGISIYGDPPTVAP